jgi:hypothetical protein
VGNNNYAFAPNETYMLNWSAGTAGFAEFTFPASTFGFSGPTVTVQINYDVFDDNPFTGNPTTDAPGTTTLDVTLNEASPEPGTLSTLAAGAVLLAGLFSRRSARSKRI